MCAIVDTNVCAEFFGEEESSAGLEFFKWVNTGSGRLVAGGKLLDELKRRNDFSMWAREAIQAGRLRILQADIVKEQTEQNRKFRSPKDGKRIKSDDPHVLAVAQVSGARLLFSNETNLHKDFRNPHLIDNPRGNVYSTKKKRDFSRSHRGLLNKRGLCQIS